MISISEALLVDFLKDGCISDAQINRVSYLVGHHHTLDCIEGTDYQTLIEADYIVNAAENDYSLENINTFDLKFFRKQAGHALLQSAFLR